MKRPCLPLPAVQAPTTTTKILPTKCLNIAEPQIFCPPKTTRYTLILIIGIDFGNFISYIYCIAGYFEGIITSLSFLQHARMRYGLFMGINVRDTYLIT